MSCNLNDEKKIDDLLFQALDVPEAPSEVLNHKLILNMHKRERNYMKRKSKMLLVGITACLMLAISITAYAAWPYLTANQFAHEIGNDTLAEAFASADAINIDKSQTADGYIFTLMGVVSGKKLNGFATDDTAINQERTYAVISVTKEDGSPMPDTSSPEYNLNNFFISPLVKGEKPWQLNIASMNGGFSEMVIEGVAYRLIECDSVQMFADRGLYLCISSSPFYDINAFDYQEESGEIKPKADYNGVNIIFDLPLDVSKANPEAAEKYLQEFYQ